MSAGKPKALSRLACACLAVAPDSTMDCIKVVSGVATLEPAGAVMLPVNGCLVAMSVPPVTTIGPKAPPGSVKLPCASLMTLTSPWLSKPSPFISMNTVAPAR